MHLRPILDLKKKVDVGLFREITTDVALLVKKYKGSFSGEHGDGIVRAEFIPLMIGAPDMAFESNLVLPNIMIKKGNIIPHTN